eukprot:524775-Pyramimonas_sp.AAC.1
MAWAPCAQRSAPTTTWRRRPSKTSNKAESRWTSRRMPHPGVRADDGARGADDGPERGQSAA